MLYRLFDIESRILRKVAKINFSLYKEGFNKIEISYLAYRIVEFNLYLIVLMNY